MPTALSHKLIGIDLDNTIIRYDASCHFLAVARGWLPAEVPANKRSVRDALRTQLGGETRWQELQALVYGPNIDMAEPAPGVLDFFRACRSAGVRTAIVSHKTRFANAFDTGVDLRQAALDWLCDNGFINSSTTGLTPESIWFESERGAKTRRIAALGCHLFIDDLEEVFDDPLFPPRVEKLLYAPTGIGRTFPKQDICVLASWSEIIAYVFGR